jgi:type IV secretory pathway VirJ component
MTSDKPRGLLCIWTDIDPAHESDFNRWYDREHMQERVAIPGFQSARRFAAVGECVRPYLALYYTDSLDVFDSEPYGRAFANQTAWSLENFKRMRGTQRRVGRLTLESGEGEGGALALFVIPQARRAEPDLMPRLMERATGATQEEFIVRASVLETDARLSTPVTADAVPAPSDALVMIEASRPEAARLQAQLLARSVGVQDSDVYTFQLLWRLG